MVDFFNQLFKKNSMKKDFYNIKINPPQPSSDDIAKHQDFDALLAQFKDCLLYTSDAADE